jgi:seryl-tRNA(Sec) selenium transferase
MRKMSNKLPIQNWINQNKLINVSGTMTALGASLVPKEIALAIEDSLDCLLILMHCKQRLHE